MKNIKFGVEIELGGYSREEASQIIANYFETRNEYVGTCYSAWAAYDREGRKWVVMSDGSVCAGRQSCEVVTPLLSYDDIEDLQEIIRELRRNGYKANHTCGIHIHIDNAGMNAKQIKNLVNFVSRREELIYSALAVTDYRKSQWCRKTDIRFKDAMNKKRNATLDDIKHIWYMTQSYCQDASDTHYDNSRYHLLNLHSMWQGKGIEFRCFNGTTHAGKIKAYIQFCLAIVAMAKGMKAPRTTELVERPSNLKAMNNLLRRLGLTGDEFKTCRQHMTANLRNDNRANAA